MTQIFKSAYIHLLKQYQSRQRMLLEMWDYIATNPYPTLKVHDNDIVLSKRFMKTLAKNQFDTQNSSIAKLFKLTNTQKTPRHCPIVLNKDAKQFFISSKEIIGKIDGSYVIDRLEMLVNHDFTEQSIIDRLLSAYIKNSGIYIDAAQNKARKKVGLEPSRRFIKPGDKMKQYLHPSLESIVERLQNQTGKDQQTARIIFDDDKVDVDHIAGLQLYNSAMLRTGMTDKTRTVDKVKDTKIVREYHRCLLETKIDTVLETKGKIDLSNVKLDRYLKAAQQCLAKLGHQLSIDQLNDIDQLDGDIRALAIQAKLDTEKAYTKALNSS